MNDSDKPGASIELIITVMKTLQALHGEKSLAKQNRFSGFVRNLAEIEANYKSLPDVERMPGRETIERSR